MKILVPVKRVVDFNVKIRVRGDGSGVDLANVKMSMNPFDEIAVEEALRLKEKGQAGEIVIVRASFRWTFRTPLMSHAFGSNDREVNATVVFRNEPFKVGS